MRLARKWWEKNLDVTCQICYVSWESASKSSYDLYVIRGCLKLREYGIENINYEERNRNNFFGEVINKIFIIFHLILSIYYLLEPLTYRPKFVMKVLENLHGNRIPQRYLFSVTVAILRTNILHEYGYACGANLSKQTLQMILNRSMYSLEYGNECREEILSI